MSGKSKWCRNESKPQALNLVSECLTSVRAFRCGINQGRKQLQNSGLDLGLGIDATFHWAHWCDLHPGCPFVPVQTRTGMRLGCLHLGWGKIAHSVVVKTFHSAQPSFTFRRLFGELRLFPIWNTFWLLYGIHTVLTQAWLMVINCFVASVFI